MSGTPAEIEITLELPAEPCRKAELYMLEHGIGFDTLPRRARTQFFALHA
jgi:hypothetical protein